MIGPALALSVLAAAAPAPCPRQPLIELPVNSWAAARSELAPPGADYGRLCRYNPFGNHTVRDLAASAVVKGSAKIGPIVSELDALKPISSTVFCPADTGSEIDMTLSYPSGHGVFIRVDLSGCETVSNGSITRTAATTKAGQRLLATLEQLTGEHK
ncbi:MAG: hypothetical protein ABSC56_04275 [Solirubrobacteraceae bacterium]|jgi:hypothetical protein